MLLGHLSAPAFVPEVLVVVALHIGQRLDDRLISRNLQFLVFLKSMIAVLEPGSERCGNQASDNEADPVVHERVGSHRCAPEKKAVRESYLAGTSILVAILCKRFATSPAGNESRPNAGVRIGLYLGYGFSPGRGSGPGVTLMYCLSSGFPSAIRLSIATPSRRANSSSSR